MNRVCILKATKRILEMQSGGEVNRIPEDIYNAEILPKYPQETYQIYLDSCDEKEAMRLNTLKQNAINAGHLDAEIEVKWVTDAEYAAAKAEDPNEIAAQAAQATKAAEQAAKAQEIIDNLPAWQPVSDAIDSATTIAALKAIVKKLARVVYIHLREQ